MDILKTIFDSCNTYYGNRTVESICETVVKVVKIICASKEKNADKKESN